MSDTTSPTRPPTLAGDIVTLRPLDPERDAADYYEMNLDPEMHRWTGNRVFASVDEAREELERFATMEGVIFWAVVDNASGKMMGRELIRLRQRDGALVAGGGMRIARPYWRKGHNKEANHLVLDYVFDVLRADRVEHQCWTENANSRLSLLSLGFSLVREEMEFSEKYGREMPVSHLALTREEWQTRRARGQR